MLELGVNIDHVATLRQARRTYEPDPVWAAVEAELGGADGITVHLREDRRHIVDRDVELLIQTVHVKLNLEMACTEEMIGLAQRIHPSQATLVPEQREEVTTEGGLDVLANQASVRGAVERLQSERIPVSLFLDPDPDQLKAALNLQPAAIELHTGPFALAFQHRDNAARANELERLQAAAEMIRQANVALHAGHGLNYGNVHEVARIERMRELNIGHCIVSRAVFVGLRQAVREMKDLLQSIQATLPANRVSDQ